MESMFKLKAESDGHDLDNELASAVARFDLESVSALISRLKEKGAALPELPATQEALDAVTTRDLKAMEKWKPKARWDMRRRVVEALQGAGWEISHGALQAMMRRALNPRVAKAERAGAVGAIGWLLEVGAFSLNSIEAPGLTVAAGPGSVLAWVFDSESAEELSVLDALVKAGILQEGGATVGLTDFAALGLWGCAKRLSAWGFTPRDVVGELRWSNAGPGMGHGAISVCARSVAFEAASQGSQVKREEVIERGVEGLRWLASLGAQAAGPGLDPLGDFAESLGQREAGDAAREDRIIKTLVEIGAQPNATKRFLIHSIKSWVGGGDGASDSLWDGLGRAVSHGADPKLWPGAALAACGSLKRKSRQSGERAMLRLIKAGADPRDCELKSSFCENPAATFFQRNAFRAGLMALDLGAPESWQEAKTGNTLLHVAASNTDPKAGAAVQELLKRPEVARLRDAVNINGQSPLMLAVRSRAHVTVKALIGAGADVNGQDIDGSSLLSLCMKTSSGKAELESEALIIELLRAGADPGLRDAQGLTPAQASIFNGSWGGLEILLAARPEDVLGADAVAQDARCEFESRGPRAQSVMEKLQISATVATRRQAPGLSQKEKIRL